MEKNMLNVVNEKNIEIRLNVDNQAINHSNIQNIPNPYLPLFLPLLTGAAGIWR